MEQMVFFMKRTEVLFLAHLRSYALIIKLSFWQGKVVKCVLNLCGNALLYVFADKMGID